MWRVWKGGRASQPRLAPPRAGRRDDLALGTYSFIKPLVAVPYQSLISPFPESQPTPKAAIRTFLRSTIYTPTVARTQDEWLCAPRLPDPSRTLHPYTPPTRSRPPSSVALISSHIHPPPTLPRFTYPTLLAPSSCAPGQPARASEHLYCEPSPQPRLSSHSLFRRQSLPARPLLRPSACAAGLTQPPLPRQRSRRPCRSAPPERLAFAAGAARTCSCVAANAGGVNNHSARVPCMWCIPTLSGAQAPYLYRALRENKNAREEE